MILHQKGGGVGVVLNSRPTKVETEPGADSQVQQSTRAVSLPFPSRAVLIRRFKTDEDLLKLFRKVEINISLLDAIKQVLKYAKFLKELCVHIRKKMKGAIEIGGILSALVKHEDANAEFNESCQRNVKIRAFSLCHAPLVTALSLMPCWT
ncbi:hypothetical protein CR513_33367, partial [Mucuna pruriens]